VILFSVWRVVSPVVCHRRTFYRFRSLSTVQRASFSVFCFLQLDLVASESAVSVGVDSVPRQTVCILIDRQVAFLLLREQSDNECRFYISHSFDQPAHVWLAQLACCYIVSDRGRIQKRKQGLLLNSGENVIEKIRVSFQIAPSFSRDRIAGTL